jgi:hypothetical protein
MATITPEQFISTVNDRQPEYQTVVSEEDGLTCVSVYPPKTYISDYAIDVFFESKATLIWCDGAQVKKFGAKASVTEVVSKVIDEIEAAEAYMHD